MLKEDGANGVRENANLRKIKKFLQVWRHQTNTRAEPWFWFRLVCWAKTGNTHKLHGRNPKFGSAIYARLNILNRPAFRRSKRFSNLKFFPKTEVHY